VIRAVDLEIAEGPDPSLLTHNLKENPVVPLKKPEFAINNHAQ